MIMDLFQPIFSMLGIGNFLITPTGLINQIVSCEQWYHLLQPQILISWLIYFMFAYGTIFVLLVMPFRWFKKLLKVPKRKW